MSHPAEAQGMTFTERVRNIIADYDGEPFKVSDVVAVLERDKIAFDSNRVRGLVSSDLIKTGFVKKTSQFDGRFRFYKGLTKKEAAKFKTTKSAPVSKNLTTTVSRLVRSKSEPFTVADIAEALLDMGVEFGLKNLQNIISSQLVQSGEVAKASADKIRPALYVSIPSKKSPASSPKKITQYARQIIEGYKGAPFIVSELLEDLEDEGVAFRRTAVDSFLHRGVRIGELIIAGMVGNVRKYKAAAAFKAPPETPPDLDTPIEAKKAHTKTFSALFFAVAAGLRKFSISYLTTTIDRVSDWTEDQAEAKARPIIQRLKSRGLLAVTPHRPAVYTVQPRFYLDNLAHMPTYCAAVPFLEERILHAFGEHCAPEIKVPDPCSMQEAPPPAEAQAPAPPTQAPTAPPLKTRKPVIPLAQIAAEIEKAIKQAADQLAAERVKEYEYKLEDKAQAHINDTNKIRDLESQNRKLIQRVERLEEVVGEKNRVNAVLQRRLNDALHGSQNSAGGTFTLGELLRVEKKEDPTIDASNSGSDITKITAGRRV